MLILQNFLSKQGLDQVWMKQSMRLASLPPLDYYVGVLDLYCTPANSRWIEQRLSSVPIIGHATS